MAAGAGPVSDTQRSRLRDLLGEILPANRFYARKLGDVAPDTDLSELPFTTKAELVADQRANPPYGTDLTYPPERYSRFHQTSGTTTGRPLCWLDTPESWERLLDCWLQVYRLVGVGPGDRVFFPFSFGPFLGFWTAFEAASRLGCLCLPAGGMSTTARLRFLAEHRATAVCCTPTYALHLAEEARREGIDLVSCAARTLIVAGEPGGAIPATRRRIEEAWGARVFDHYGLTEVGPVAAEPAEEPGGLRVLEDDYIVEVIDPRGTAPVPPGEVGELVLTSLGRVGSPLIRYRTGDLVRAGRGADGSLRLEGGILARADDMIHLRGNNLYPGAIEAVVRRFAGVAEFRVTVDRSRPLAALRVELEPAEGAGAGGLAAEVARALRDELLFRAEVVAVAPGTLPRFELKAKRFVFVGEPVPGGGPGP